MRSGFLAFWLSALALGLSGCSKVPAPAPTETTEPTASAADPQEQETSEPAPDVEGAKAALKAEKRVIDFVYQPDESVQWLIGVKDDGSPRFGYAEYVCNLLHDHGFSMKKAWVRIVDYRRFMLDGDHHAASLGSVICATGQHMMP